jgi:hypothetical protein
VKRVDQVKEEELYRDVKEEVQHITILKVLYTDTLVLEKPGVETHIELLDKGGD